ncbi:MAG: DNA-binding domain-containing protein [Bermanella sp.]
MPSQQQTLMDAILSQQENMAFEKRGLEIYQRNLLASAQRALQITFPTVLQLIGEELFIHATKNLLQRTPPAQGDWGLWGDEFPARLKALSQLTDYPYVAECAELDLVRHKLERAEDRDVLMSSLQLLAELDPDNIEIILSANLKFWASAFPIVDIYHGHAETQQGKEDWLQKAKDKLENNQGQKLLLYRPQFKAQLRALKDDEYKFLSLLSEGISLGRTLDLMISEGYSDFSFEQWLPLAIQQNLISCLKQP